MCGVRLMKRLTASQLMKRLNRSVTSIRCGASHPNRMNKSATAQRRNRDSQQVVGTIVLLRNGTAIMTVATATMKDRRIGITTNRDT